MFWRKLGFKGDALDQNLSRADAPPVQPFTTPGGAVQVEEFMLRQGDFERFFKRLASKRLLDRKLAHKLGE